MSLSSTEIKAIRKFGLIAVVFFGALLIISLWRHKVVPGCFFGVLFILGLCFLWLPTQSSPVYQTWLKVAHFIGKITTALILTITYYLVITPMALIKALLGGRPLPVRPDKKAASYWVPRPEPVQPNDRFSKRY